MGAIFLMSLGCGNSTPVTAFELSLIGYKAQYAILIAFLPPPETARRGHTATLKIGAGAPTSAMLFDRVVSTIPRSGATLPLITAKLALMGCGVGKSAG